MRENMEPIMLPGNDSIISGIRPWIDDDFLLDEELEDVVENNLQIFNGRRRAMTTRGRGTSRFHSPRSEKGQRKHVGSPKAGNGVWRVRSVTHSTCTRLSASE